MAKYITISQDLLENIVAREFKYGAFHTITAIKHAAQREERAKEGEAEGDKIKTYTIKDDPIWTLRKAAEHMRDGYEIDFVQLQDDKLEDRDTKLLIILKKAA